MKLLLAGLLLLSCAGNPNIYDQAREYPELYLIVFSGMIDYNNDGIVESFAYGYDIDGDPKFAEVWAIYRIVNYLANNQYELSSSPHTYVYWSNKTAIGVQFDGDMDHRIDSVSGDVKKIVKILERIKGSQNERALSSIPE